MKINVMGLSASQSYPMAFYIQNCAQLNHSEVYDLFSALNNLGVCFVDITKGGRYCEYEC